MELKSKYSNEIFILDAYNKSFYLIIYTYFKDHRSKLYYLKSIFKVKKNYCQNKYVNFYKILEE